MFSVSGRKISASPPECRRFVFSPCVRFETNTYQRARERSMRTIHPGACRYGNDSVSSLSSCSHKSFCFLPECLVAAAAQICSIIWAKRKRNICIYVCVCVINDNHHHQNQNNYIFFFSHTLICTCNCPMFLILIHQLCFIHCFFHIFESCIQHQLRKSKKICKGIEQKV